MTRRYVLRAYPNGIADAASGGMSEPCDLRARTMAFAVSTFDLCRTLPKTDEVRDIVRQLRRAASSVAANYRALCRASTDRVFASKASTLIEEADEVSFWLELMVNIGLVPGMTVSPLRTEANELVAIFVATRKTISARIARQRSEQRTGRTQNPRL